MAWRIEFDAGALKDLRGFDRQVARRITQFLRERLAVTDDPRALATPLKSPRSGPGAAPLWRYRVGDWRIVAHIEPEAMMLRLTGIDITVCRQDEVLRVLILRIAHRREVHRRLTRPGVE